MRNGALLLFLFLVLPALPGQAQSHETTPHPVLGAWTMTLTTPNGQEMQMPLHGLLDEDEALQLQMPTQDGNAMLMEQVAFTDNRLQFEIPVGHGPIRCKLNYVKAEDVFSGLCEGPQGEGPTVLRRTETE